MSIPNPIVLLDARARYVHPAFQMSRASTKTVWDSAGRLVTVPPNALGWDHDPATGQARGYLAEPGATNLLLHSNDLTQGAWNKVEATVTGDAITGPDGNGMAKVVASTEYGLHHFNQTIAHSSAGVVSVSLLCAPGELSDVFIEVLQSESNTQVFYNLDGNGSTTIPGLSAPVDYGIERVGDFYRLWLVYETADSSNGCRFGMLLDHSGGRDFAGDGTSGLYFGHLQAEPGGYPTSYIETGGATATRASDNSTIPHTAVANGYWGTRHTFVLEIDVPQLPKDSTHNIFAHVSGFALRRTPSNNIEIVGTQVNNGTVLQAQDAPGRHVIALAWDDEGIVVAADGAIVRERVFNGTLSTSPTLVLGGDGSHIYRSNYYPARISNADLQSLTAIQE